MNETLSTHELIRLIQSVFRPTAEDRGLALLVDLPDDHLEDHAEWAARRRLVSDWHERLREAGPAPGMAKLSLVAYRNARRNNADLPETCWILRAPELPNHADRVTAEAVPFSKVFSDHSILIAVTELSATAPMKLNAPRYGFRAATMPGFNQAMVPALKLDYEEIHRRCHALKERLDVAVAADFVFEAGGDSHELRLDLRHRKATASDGWVRESGRAGNLPSGETYIVPYEGERESDPSRTRGILPLQLDGELLFYVIEANRVTEVLGQGPRAAAERHEVETEPAYANVAELGLGVLADFGVSPVGELLLDEKLGLHIAFGRSDHFGGQIGAKEFSAPDKVVHIDRVYLPEIQPDVVVRRVDLEHPDGSRTPLMRDGVYV